MLSPVSSGIRSVTPVQPGGVRFGQFFDEPAFEAGDRYEGPSYGRFDEAALEEIRTVGGTLHPEVVADTRQKYLAGKQAVFSAFGGDFTGQDILRAIRKQYETIPQRDAFLGLWEGPRMEDVLLALMSESKGGLDPARVTDDALSEACVDLYTCLMAMTRVGLLDQAAVKRDETPDLHNLMWRPAAMPNT